jgi:hypothetical protein
MCLNRTQAASSKDRFQAPDTAFERGAPHRGVLREPLSATLNRTTNRRASALARGGNRQRVAIGKASLARSKSQKGETR